MTEIARQPMQALPRGADGNPMTRDEWRSARLLFAPELSAGLVEYQELARPEVFAAVRSERTPGPVRRLRQRARQRSRGLDLERSLFAPLMHARESVLGEEAYGEPRVLVRVDEFPHCQAGRDPDQYGTDRYRRFHEILRASGVPYLAALLPRVPSDPYEPGSADSRPLDEGERAFLDELRGDSVELALHGLDHRTRQRRPSRHSELSGLTDAALVDRLARAKAQVAEYGVDPRVLVPPYNRFSRKQYHLLANRFDMICGGPESVGAMGFQRAPLWRGEAVYFPSYAPLYGRAEDAVEAIDRLAALQVPVWAQVTLHWGWEQRDGFVGLERSVARLAAFARPWSDVLAEVDASRDPVEATPSTRLLASPARRRPGFAARRSSRVA